MQTEGTHMLTHRQTQNRELEHAHSQPHPYKACGLELYPTMLGKSARALFSLQAAVHSHTHTHTATYWHRSVLTTDSARLSPLWPAACHCCVYQNCRTDFSFSSLQRISAAGEPSDRLSNLSTLHLPTSLRGLLSLSCNR